MAPRAGRLITIKPHYATSVILLLALGADELGESDRHGLAREVTDAQLGVDSESTADRLIRRARNT